MLHCITLSSESDYMNHKHQHPTFFVTFEYMSWGGGRERWRDTEEKVILPGRNIQNCSCTAKRNTKGRNAIFKHQDNHHPNAQAKYECQAEKISSDPLTRGVEKGVSIDNFPSSPGLLMNSKAEFKQLFLDCWRKERISSHLQHFCPPQDTLWPKSCFYFHILA